MPSSKQKILVTLLNKIVELIILILQTLKCHTRLKYFQNWRAKV
nr:MAG TPA: hypothetical protein [Bacteriophage sp.]